MKTSQFMLFEIYFDLYVLDIEFYINTYRSVDDIFVSRGLIRRYADVLLTL